MLKFPGSIAVALACAVAGCSAGAASDEATAEAAITTDAGCQDGGLCDRLQVPPTGTVEVINAWLATGAYKAWACEQGSHDPRPPSGHYANRICTNARGSAHAAGEYPVGSASVKELFADDGTTIIGYAIGTKVAAGGGEAWYWFERINQRIAANGLGNTGPAKTICVRCHNRAGGATFGHDQVFTQVR